ncbi:MAG TPA: SpoIIE family protein phosphatase [Vicinamibacteria bacterium]|nr:SpoIIE family protein phosphatase [Vicinamibacteria bacterium]
MSAKVPSVLIVDDEEMVISSLRGVFALQTDYEILASTSPREAMEHVSRTPIDVVISDFLMPEMNGIELLKAVKELQPDAIRLLLTGYADKENAIKAINEVGLYHYLEKPWDNDALLNIVSNALAEKSLRRKLREKVRELDSLLSRHEALEVKHRFLERELEMAARVQQSLLPKNFPRMAGYRFATLYQPCEAIGGDFVDVAEPEDGRAVLLISDVIGHGVQAALSTMLLKGVFQESVIDAESPQALLSEMNRRLHAVLPNGMYAAAAVFDIRSDSHTVPFSNAGLPYPFVLRSKGCLNEFAVAGPPLGLLEPDLVPYESRSLELHPGDVLLAGSDGLGSIANSSGAMFEDEELRRVLTELAGRDGEEVIREAMERALDFGERKPLPDDVNLVAVTRI